MQILWIGVRKSMLDNKSCVMILPEVRSIMYTIMIIEDDPKIAGLLKSHIERYGDRAVLVEDFEMIVQQFEQVQPHVVLLDINLPSYDGFYWCRQIRTLSTCPILFISARSGKMDQVMALENGADDYITKPFEHEIVIAKFEVSCAGYMVTMLHVTKNARWNWTVWSCTWKDWRFSLVIAKCS